MPAKKLEAVYDAEISPLMTQIIAICKRANIPCHASFSLDGDLNCTTHIDPGKEKIAKRDTEAYAAWRRRYDAAFREVSGTPSMFAITTRDAAGNVLHEEIIADVGCDPQDQARRLREAVLSTISGASRVLAESGNTDASDDLDDAAQEILAIADELSASSPGRCHYRFIGAQCKHVEGHEGNHFTDIMESAASLSSGPSHEVRFDHDQSEPDGTIDEVVGRGPYHAEMMDDNLLWMQLGPDVFHVSARGKLRFTLHGPVGDFAESNSGAALRSVDRRPDNLLSGKVTDG